jgi:hypothetical protein
MTGVDVLVFKPRCSAAERRLRARNKGGKLSESHEVFGCLGKLLTELGDKFQKLFHLRGNFFFAHRSFPFNALRQLGSVKYFLKFSFSSSSIVAVVNTRISM